MNKKLIAIAIGAAFFIEHSAVSLAAEEAANKYTTVNVAGTDITLSGRIDVSEDLARVGPARTTHSIVDNTSRLGLTGIKDIGDGLKTQFGLEYGLNVDQGTYLGTSTSTTTANTAQFRSAYGALLGGFGALAVGRLDSSNPTGSPLYSQVTSSITFAAHDGGSTAIGTSVLNARNRTSNSIGYMTPKFGGAFSIRARYYTSGPENTYNAGTIGGVATEGDYKQFDLGFNYNKGPLNAGIGYGSDSKRGGLLANNFNHKWQLVGSYDFRVVKPYAFFGRDTFDLTTAATRSSVNYWLVGVDVPFAGSHKIVGNYMQRDVQSDKNGKFKKAQVAYQYFLNKDDIKPSFLYVSVDVQDPNSNVANDTQKVLSLGYQLNF
ncbi:porin [Undibacterium sp. TS12]|uniref:porin n=1 Tax=Undibacterium sp. TS12 TaxID=2908202 RepID=UPI001F4D1C24|nr:porin [Undibacterium sp. TS12]MCH8620539.1 porin [Undibacterium sp. TS12]